MNSHIIKIFNHKSLIVRIDANDLTEEPAFDHETGDEYTSVYLLGKIWLGYNHGTIESYAQSLTGTIINFGMSDELIAKSYSITEADRRLTIQLLRKNYQQIVDKLDADLQHNMHRAHHQGYWNGSENYGRLPVCAAIESFLAKAK